MFGGREREPVRPGAKIAPHEVHPVDAPLYETAVLRTLFLEFDNPEWEAELADFYRSDVEVPATLIVDGRKYPNVGVHFRGMSSYFTVGVGQKRSLNVSLDFVDDKQRLYGYKTLNLLNSHEDPTFLHTVLYSHIVRKYIPAPKANFVKLVINGESWGVYVNVQQFNKDFVAENYSSGKGTRWKVRGSPGGRGGLEYLGDDLEEYKRRYEMKSNDGDDAWRSLVTLCKTLNQTPIDQLPKALEPLLDVDGVLWFLALENAFINSDGYWIRASDYCIFRDNQGKFHLVPHDMNETFQAAMGPGMGGFGMGGPAVGGPGRGGPGGGPDIPPRAGDVVNNRASAPSGAPVTGSGPPRGSGLELDPLTGLSDNSKPLRSRLLAVPEFKVRYLKHVRTIATDWLDWKKLEPLVNQHVALIGKEVEADTRKLSSYDAFRQSTSGEATEPTVSRRPQQTLRSFAEKRREFLLNHPEIKNLAP